MSLINFYKENMKMIHKCWVNQIAMSAFGLMVTLPIHALSQNKGYGNLPIIAVSIFAIGFYCFINYDAFWDWGTRVSLKSKNNQNSSPKLALKIGMFAYIPTAILTVAMILFYYISSLGDVALAGNISGVCSLLLSVIVHGMYNGLMWVLTAKYSILFILFLIPMPLTCYLGYSIGSKGKKLYGKYVPSDDLKK